MADKTTVVTGDIETVSQQILDLVTTISDKIIERLSIAERSIDALDQQFAMLAVGFAEQAVLIEALVGQLNYSTEEEREQFDKRVKAKRKEMLGVLKEGGMAFADDDPEVAEALERLLPNDKGSAVTE